ncbi:MAG: helix-turn-helix domain-containing protein [Spirochaetaceae bacterium]|jgi:addiction module HigA family antidote|nr:helix-turn-helix domain-containing protein [Spirochaetaceae bacterium]
MAKTSNKTPGTLLQEYADKNGLQLKEVAQGIGERTQVLLQIIRGKKPIDAKIALLLAKFFGTTKTYWIDFQKKYELKVAEAEVKAALGKVKKYVKPARRGAKAAAGAKTGGRRGAKKAAAEKTAPKRARRGAKKAGAAKTSAPKRTRRSTRAASDTAAKPRRRSSPRAKPQVTSQESPIQTSESLIPSFE